MKKLVAFFEIPATDFGRAVTFYETVLNLKLSIMDCETEKMAFFPEENGKCPGAISFASGFNPSGDGVLISLSVDNMEETVLLIETAGGKVTRKKTKIEADGMGFFAIFTDSEGNSIGLYSDC
ncbi:MAG: VOC family protein [Tannerella sp.]|jgi:predicted enzyme related to lactoylglutathione lyase|nr:VOC family protein [Tannerella sp.]